MMCVYCTHTGARSVMAYLPEGVWYEFYNLTATTKTGKTWVQVDAPLDRVPVGAGTH